MEIKVSIDCYVEHIVSARRLSAATVIYYEREVRLFADYLSAEGITQTEEISPLQARLFQAQRMEEGLRPGTIKRVLAALRGWCKFLKRRGWTQFDLMEKTVVPRQPKHLPIFFRQDEVEHIYDQGLFADDYYGQRDRLLLRILYETGIRAAEASGLKPNSVDRSLRVLRVLGKGNKERLIPIEQELLNNIEQFLTLKSKEAIDCDYLFVNHRGKRMSDNNIYTVVRKYMLRFSNADRISTHVFRHTFATHLLNEGANIAAIKDLLGHADLSATQIYTHVSREHLKQTYKQAHPRAQKKEET